MSPRAAAPRKVVVTAGPTREYVDPVRYLSNESSGKQGFAIAAACAARGDDVTLIAGPVHLDTPPGVHRIDVMSAREMLAALKEAFSGADALYMAAAVADWRPRRRLAGKWRKKDDGTDTAAIELVKNPDILATVARRKGERLVVGFALETGDGKRRALAKLRRKNADYVVLNDETALGADHNSVTILGRDGSEQHIAKATKQKVAKALAKLERPVVAG
ncbi:MAG: phosphopantothenoylcysteine decarboxylase domain-containing protein [Planctomycetota bacterium]